MATLRKKPLDYYKALYEIGSDIGSATAVESQLAAMAESATKAIGAKGCSIMLLTEDQKKLVRMADYGLSNSYIKKGLVELDSVTAEALKGNPVVVRDATNDSRVQYRAQAKREGIVSMVTLPLVLKGKVAGILRAYADRPTEFSVADIAFLSSVANLSATASSKDQIYRTMEQYYQDVLDSKVQELADILRGAVAGTRPAMDKGWVDEARMIGQSGKTVKPGLFVSLGASGAMHYTTGFMGSKVVLAVDKNPQAPIFQMADIGIVGDLHEVVPCLIEELKKDRTPQKF